MNAASIIALIALLAVGVAAARRPGEAAGLLRDAAMGLVRRLARTNLPMAVVLLPALWIFTSGNPSATALRERAAGGLRDVAGVVRQSRPPQDDLPHGCVRAADGRVSCARPDPTPSPGGLLPPGGGRSAPALER